MPHTAFLKLLMISDSYLIYDISIGGFRGAHPARAPLRDPILSFWHTNFTKRSCLGSPRPPTLSTPPYGKSWIRHWFLWGNWNCTLLFPVNSYSVTWTCRVYIKVKISAKLIYLKVFNIRCLISTFRIWKLVVAAAMCACQASHFTNNTALCYFQLFLRRTRITCRCSIFSCHYFMTPYRDVWKWVLYGQISPNMTSMTVSVGSVCHTCCVWRCLTIENPFSDTPVGCHKIEKPFSDTIHHV